MSKVVVGDILLLKIKYPDGEIAQNNHYYLVIEELKGNIHVMLEIAQFDTLTKEKDNLRYEDYISVVKGEDGACIFKESYIDKRKEIRIENYPGLEKYKVNNPVSISTRENVIRDCRAYMETRKESEKISVSMLKEDIEDINK